MSTLRLATPDDIDALMRMVTAFHDQEGITQDDSTRRAALMPLLEGTPLGCIWMIGPRLAPVGYIAVSFSWSIEFGGIDAIIDEFFIRPTLRGRGMGSEVLSQLIPALADQGIRAISLEVSTDNSARRLYQSKGFAPRDNYRLMTRPLA